MSKRYVAGLGPSGKSRVVSETELTGMSDIPGVGATNLWTGRLEGLADNASPVEQGLAPFRFEQLAEPVYAMMLAEYAPGMGADDPHMHFTDTADHFYMLEGEAVLVLEEGDVVLRPGDVGICRGVMHGWRNDGDKPARLVTFVLPAAPLGASA